MQKPSPSRTTTAAQNPLFEQAASAGRNTLNPAELGTLLSGLGIELVRDASPTMPPPTVELRFSLNNTREFGMVISAGLGGLDAELDEGNFRKDRAAVYAATELTDAAGFLDLFKRTLAYQRLAGIAKRAGRHPADGQLKTCFEQMLTLAKGFAPGDPEAAFVLHSLELNPVHMGDRLTVQTAHCEFGAPPAGRLPRPVHKIDKLIHPASIGIIGVSAGNMNFGRIILRNLMGSGYAKERLCIIRAGETEIDG
ncbi:MAG: hypothetical protein Q7U75_03700, partial [Desulfobacterales bacterium]|nr:hypothetical protein [Desulfobacterales bacterium]